MKILPLCAVLHLHSKIKCRTGDNDNSLCCDKTSLKNIFRLIFHDFLIKLN